MIFGTALRLRILYFLSLKGWENKVYSENYLETALCWLGDYYFYSAKGWVTKTLPK